MRFKSSLVIITTVLFFGILVLLSLARWHAAQVQAQSNLGALDQGQVRIPDNYTNWTPPVLGASYNDAAYGTTIKRVSNGLSQFGEGVHHEFATISPFNRDNTRLILLNEKRGYYVADLNGNIVISDVELELGAKAEPRWSLSDANLFFFHQDNKLLRYDLRTRQKTMIRTFTQYDYISFGFNDAELSGDGDYIFIAGYSGARTFLGVYRFSNDTLGSTLEFTSLGSIVSSDLTPSNNVILRWAAQGEGRYKGFELFDRNMSFIRQLFRYGARADSARDLNGDEVLLLTAENDAQPAAGCENNGIQKLRLADGNKTCLLPLFFGADISISSNNSGGHPWVLISTTDLNGTANPNSSLPSDWQSRWKARYNDILLVKLDGSEKRRLAHHRSRVIGDYWWQPRASISRDGRYAVFDSNFGTQPRPLYTDVFLIALNPGTSVNTVSSVSAASFSGVALASEIVAAGFGSGLATTSQSANTLPLPTTLAGTTVSVRDSGATVRNAPLFFVSPNQVNYLVPNGTALGTATVTITSGNGTQAVGNIQIEHVAPGLFAASSNGQGIAAALALRARGNGTQSFEPVARFDQGQNSFVPVPIDLGAATDQVFLILYGTGWRNRTSLAQVSVKVGGIDTQISYAGAQGSLAGLDQINILLPRTLAGRDDVDVVLSVEGKAANVVRVQIK